MTKSLLSLLIVFLWGIIISAAGYSTEKPIFNQLTEDLQVFVDSVNGEIGIAILTDTGDNIFINNDRRYPMMSVFKLHQSVATLRHVEHKSISIDSIVSINRNDLDNSTWSPMLKEYTGNTISISYRDLLRYSLTASDNNASNFLFENLLDIQSVDSIIGNVIPREEFRIVYSEAEMQQQHSRAFDNFTSPLGAALLVEKLYMDSTLLSSDNTDFIRNCMEECKTGTDRIVEPLLNISGLKIGHKTGSGYRDNGVLIAHNDVAFIELPDKRHYVLSVFIKNFRGSEKDASKVIARVSSLVYDYISR